MPFSPLELLLRSGGAVAAAAEDPLADEVAFQRIQAEVASDEK